MMDLFAGALVFGAGVAVGGLIMAVIKVGSQPDPWDAKTTAEALDRAQKANARLRRTNAELAAALHEHHPTY